MKKRLTSLHARPIVTVPDLGPFDMSQPIAEQDRVYFGIWRAVNGVDSRFYNTRAVAEADMPTSWLFYNHCKGNGNHWYYDEPGYVPAQCDWRVIFGEMGKYRFWFPLHRFAMDFRQYFGIVDRPERIIK